MHDEILKVGELARRSGVSVRTLHHYDAIGLLKPSFTTGAGHRCYSAADVTQLAHVRALVTLGFSLAEVREALDDPDTSPLSALDLVAARARARLHEARSLADRLEQLISTLRTRRGADLNDLLEILMTMDRFQSLHEKYYTPEQLAQLGRRRDELGEEGMREAQAAWQQLFADAQTAAEAGLDPSGPEGRALVQRKRALIEAFTGGDAGIHESLRRMYAQNPDLRQAVAGEPAGMEFLREAEGAGETD